MADTYFTTPDNNTEVTNSKCSGEGNSTAKPPISTCPPRRRSCPCNCDLVTTFLRDPVDDEEVLTVEERTEQIVSELTVDKKNTTLSRMRYMSARDNRTSAVGIGAVAALIIFSIIGVIVLIDLTRMIHDIKNGLGGLLTMLGLHGLHSAMKLQRVPDNTTHDSPVIASATSTAVSSLSETPLTITECPDYMDFVSDEIFGMNMDIGGHVPPASTSLS